MRKHSSYVIARFIRAIYLDYPDKPGNDKRICPLLCALLLLVLGGCESENSDIVESVSPQKRVMDTALSCRRNSNGVIEIPDKVLFEYNSFLLTEASQKILECQTSWLTTDGQAYNITVEGHADERGTREYNLALGERRAQAAKDYLVASGVAAERITTISYGKERPAVLGNDEAAWSQNRRAVSALAQ